MIDATTARYRTDLANRNFDLPKEMTDFLSKCINTEAEKGNSSVLIKLSSIAKHKSGVQCVMADDVIQLLSNKLFAVELTEIDNGRALLIKW